MGEIDIEKCEFITKFYDCRICNGKSLRIHCKDNNNCYYKQLQQYKNAFDEIEEIIIKRQKEHYCYCDECSPFKEILQKIKEVKGNG